PHDRLAAMMHLGRAVEDAPESRFAAGRLAAIAIEAAASSRADSALTGAALRTLTRAMVDAPNQVDLLEASAAIQARLGHGREAEASARKALALDPSRARLYALLSEVCRARGDNGAAIAALEEGGKIAPDDVVLVTERGIVLSVSGEELRARELWNRVLTKEPIYPPAFANAAAAAMRDADETTAHLLVDRALGSFAPAPDVVRQAIALALAKERPGVARAARLAKLARAIVDRIPNDAWALLVLAQALSQTGEKSEAVARFRQVEGLAGDSALATQAQRGRFALDEPQATLEVDAVLRAAGRAPTRDLRQIIARATRLADAHDAWTAWLAIAMAERRLGDQAAARQAAEHALRVSPGCTLAHVELVSVAVASKDADAALVHAERIRELEGESQRALGALATAYLAQGRLVEARIVAEKALALDPHDPASVVLVAKVRDTMEEKPSVLGRIKSFFVGAKAL
ncbi:MAG: tetratricopeptide repeat protein, partial [Polyangiaceae bacterium]